MILIAGLGNPGSAHKNNRHNVGFLALDKICRQHSFGNWRKKFSSEIALGQIDGRKVLALKPMTYMNESGRAVSAAKLFFKISTNNIIILHDEIDIPSGTLQVKKGGGHAGHNGVKNIHSHIGSNYLRVRIGVGRPSQKNEVVNYVLTDFSQKDEIWLGPLIQDLATHIGLVIREDGATFKQKIRQFDE